jgi:plastocyanin
MGGACGGGDGENGGSPPADGGSAECGGSGGRTERVEASNFTFDPNEISARPGVQVTVEFTNNDETPHTFTIDELSCDTGNVNAGQSAELSFTMPDQETPWVCTIHPDMKGLLKPKR